MPVNDFEKNVQQKMEGFQLTPSASVWNEVKERVRLESKRRRRIIFWWMIPLMITGVGTLLYFSQTGKKTAEKTISQQPQINQPAPVAEQAPGKQPAEKTTASSGTEINNTVPQPFVKGNPDAVNPQKNTQSVTGTQGVTGRQGIPAAKETKRVQSTRENMIATTVPGKKSNRKAVAAADNTNTNAVVTITGNNPVRPVDNLPIDVTEMKDDHIILTADASEPVSNRPDITVLHPLPVDIAVSKPKVKVPETSDENPLVRISKKNKWETGLVIGLGVAARTSSPLAGPAEKSLNLYSSPNATVPNSPVFTPPGALLGRSLFKAGLYTRKQITGRTAFSTGLQYANYSTKQETGVFIDSILVITSNRSGYVRADGFYRSGKTYVFNNKYFLVQAPLLFEWQLGKGVELPLSWVNGLTPSMLAGTNSLVFNNATGAYYKDKTAYNSFQLFYNTGLTARFGADSKHPVTAGITLEYAITGLHKNKSTEKNNLVSFGFQLKYALKK